jgi:hypothetical protein
VDWCGDSVYLVLVRSVHLVQFLIVRDPGQALRRVGRFETPLQREGDDHTVVI